MVWYPQEHEDATRRRIVDRSARRFEADGIDGSGVATLRADAEASSGVDEVVALAAPEVTP